jgi:hypothetical protein
MLVRRHGLGKYLVKPDVCGWWGTRPEGLDGSDGAHNPKVVGSNPTPATKEYHVITPGQMGFGPPMRTHLKKVTNAFVITLSSPGGPRMTIDKLVGNSEKPLVQELVRQLKDNGGIKIGLEHVGDVEQFRKAARAAARQIGITVHTGISHEEAGDFVFAFET